MRLAVLAGLLWTGAAAAGIEDCVAIADDAQRLACYDAAAAARTTSREAEAAPAPRAAPATDFGKPPAPAPPETVTSIEARIVGTVRRWERGTRFTLDNGQVWKATGDDSAFYPDLPENPAVVIRRGRLGAYWLELKDVGRKIKVQRIS